MAEFMLPNVAYRATVYRTGCYINILVPFFSERNDVALTQTHSSSLSVHRDKIKHISDYLYQFETPYQLDVKVAVVLH